MVLFSRKLKVIRYVEWKYTGICVQLLFLVHELYAKSQTFIHLRERGKWHLELLCELRIYIVMERS